MPRLYDVSTYRDYLRQHFESAGERSGVKSKFASAIGIKSSFLSQVLSEQAHLSLEQGERANGHLSHSVDESHLFLLMIQRDRAGSPSLKAYFDEQISKSKKKKSVRNLLKTSSEISKEARATYYSSWLFAAMHVAVTVPELQSRRALKEYFDLSSSRLNEVVDFLIRSGLVEEKKGRLMSGPFGIHLDPNSPEMPAHHIGWRLRSAECLGRGDREKDLHYSAVVSISRKDVEKVRASLMRGLGDSIGVIRDSKEEAVYAINIDLFDVAGR